MSDNRNGRNARGLFQSGNQFAKGRGNPFAARVQAWRRAFAECVSTEEMREVVEILKSRALSGERWAICELLERCLGKAGEGADLIAQIATLERQVEKLESKSESGW